MKLLRQLAAGVLLTVLGAQTVSAQEHTAVRAGFELPAKSGKTILVFRPAVKVGAQSTGGMFEPNGDWTDQARKNIENALAARQAGLGNTVVMAPTAFGDEAQLIEEYQSLFSAVSQAVIQYQFFKGNRLPTKKREDKAGVFEWSLGSGVSALPGATNADYALFLYNRDAYGSTGRKILQMVALLGPGIAIKSGEHAGYAGLVDLKTGDILWLNADMAMGGDVRTEDGAQKRVGQLLEEFPGSAPLKPVAANP